jgi:hypothetical protein
MDYGKGDQNFRRCLPRASLATAGTVVQGSAVSVNVELAE